MMRSCWQHGVMAASRKALLLRIVLDACTKHRYTDRTQNFMKYYMAILGIGNEAIRNFGGRGKDSSDFSEDDNLDIRNLK